MNTKGGPWAVEFSFHDGVGCIQWSNATHRWHVWCDPATLDPRVGVIYKNSVRGTRYSRTIKSSVNSAVGRANLAAAQAIVRRDGLVAAAQAKQQAEEAADQAKRNAAIREHRIKEAGPDLLAALRRIVQLDDAHRPALHPDAVMAIAAAKDAIAKAES